VSLQNAIKTSNKKVERLLSVIIMDVLKLFDSPLLAVCRHYYKNKKSPGFGAF
jgi:hypothetical protein